MTTTPRWRDAASQSFWLDDLRRPEAHSEFLGTSACDIAVIGGGFTGLWSALLAKQRRPNARVILVEAARIAEHASGRNGGFCAASLTHGDANGRSRWPEEMPTLRALGAQNLQEILDTIHDFSIDCDLECTGQLDIATAPWQARDLREECDALATTTIQATYLDHTTISDEFGSPLATAGLLDEDGCVLLNPARLAWGLASAFESLGGELFEHTRVNRLQKGRQATTLHTDRGAITARQVIVATSAFRPLVKRTRGRVVPVYDYVLITEPLSDTQLSEIRWTSRRGVSDAGNQFHYLRLTSDNRILFGGYEAVYRFNQSVHPSFDQDDDVFALLQEHFDAFFPTLTTLGFSHRWGGAIDTSTRFCASVTLSHNDSVATINGFTGLGVGASRFFASGALDLLEKTSSPATNLALFRHASLPFPPEPFRFLGIEFTRRAIARADRHNGRRGLWLRLLDALGLGFDS